MLLLALFIGVPLIEIALFVQLGSVLDLGWILLIVVLTAILGTWLVRRQGRDVLRQIQGSFETLNDPTEPLAHGAMILFSGALLLTPGFFTDTVGFLLLVPAFREVAFRWIRTRVVTSASFQASVHTSGQSGPHGPRHSPRRSPSGVGSRPDIVDGDYTDVTAAQPDAANGEERPSGSSGWTRR